MTYACANRFLPQGWFSETAAINTLILSLLMLFILSTAGGAAQTHDHTAVLGRFGQLSYRNEGLLTNADYNLYVERGFKLLYPSKELHPDGWLGGDAFAAFVTLRLPQGINQYELLIDADSGTKVTELTTAHAVVSKEITVSGKTYGLQATVWANYPVVWFKGEVEADVPEVTYAILGYNWAGLTPPDIVIFHSDQGLVERKLADKDRISLGKVRSRTALCIDSKRGIGFGIVAASDEAVLTYEQGMLLVTVPNREGLDSIAITTIPNFYCPWRPGDSESFLALSSSSALGGHPPKNVTTRFGTETGKPFIQYDLCLDDELQVDPVLAIPATALGETQTDNILPNPLGGTALVHGTSVRLALDLPPRIAQILPDTSAVSGVNEILISGYVQYILRYALAEGGFKFSLGRAFYDGITCGILAQALPVLPEQLRSQTIDVIKKTLDFWWNNLKYDSFRKVWFFAEPELTDSVVDYPEITGTVLYATLAYATAVDPDYVKLKGSKTS